MKKKTIIRLLAGIAVAAFLLYHSIYITPLAERKAALQAAVFNPQHAIDRFWAKAPALMKAQAVDLTKVGDYAPQELATRFGHTLGIGAPYSICLTGTAKIVETDGDVVRLDVPGEVPYYLRTGAIFSNTVREASGQFNIDDYETTMDFNLVALELNRRILQEVIEPVKARLTAGTVVTLTGAADIRPDRLPWKRVEIVPIELKIEN
jgi:predicted lipoprotein